MNPVEAGPHMLWLMLAVVMVLTTLPACRAAGRSDTRTLLRVHVIFLIVRVVLGLASLAVLNALVVVSIFLLTMAFESLVLLYRSLPSVHLGRAAA